MKIIGKTVFLFMALLLFGCNIWPILDGTFATSWLDDNPDGFVDLVIFQGDIIDIEREGISSKGELIAFIDTTLPIIPRRLFVWIYYNDITWYRYHWRVNAIQAHHTAHINTFQNDRALLKTTEFYSGMPIILGTAGSLDWAGGLPSSLERNRINSRRFSSKNYVLLVKGDPEYWADSAFQYDDRTFVILPVSDGTPNAEIRFTYSITRTTVEESSGQPQPRLFAGVHCDAKISLERQRIIGAPFLLVRDRYQEINEYSFTRVSAGKFTLTSSGN